MMNKSLQHTRRLAQLITFLLIVAIPEFANAHEPDHSYIFLRVYEKGIDGRIEVTANDLNRSIGLNIPKVIMESEVTPVISTIQSYLKQHIFYKNQQTNFTVRFTETKVLNLDDEDDYIEFHFELDGITSTPELLDMTYDAFFDNSEHKGMLIIEYNWKAGIIDNHTLVAEIFSPNDIQKQISMDNDSVWTGFVAMIKLGIWHIWIGLDHILFLVALVLPSVVRRNKDIEQTVVADNDVTANNGVWSPVARFNPAALYMIKIVTFFTLAHSITLAIASLGIMDLPSRYVESVIAFSIALAAFHNIIPIFKSKEWVIAFAFGLFHGFGFASVLGEKGLGGDFMIWSLLGFNGGVEIGQIAIIAVVFPILYLIRTFNFYPKLLTYGSALLILISLHWSIERFFDVNISIGRWVTSILTQIQTI